MKAVNSRYTFEVLNTAYRNMWYHKEIAMITIPVNNPDTDEVELYFHTPKEIADSLMIDFFKIFHQIDVIVQDDNIDNYDVAYFNIYDDMIEIGYVGNKVNTDFEVNLLTKDGHWYLSKIGTQLFNPPELVENT